MLIPLKQCRQAWDVGAQDDVFVCVNKTCKAEVTRHGAGGGEANRVRRLQLPVAASLPSAAASTFCHAQPAIAGRLLVNRDSAPCSLLSCITQQPLCR